MNKNQIKNTTKGFTLVEIIIYTGLFSVFLLVITDLFISVAKAHFLNPATAGVLRDAQYLQSRLSYDLKKAEEVVVPSSAAGQGSELHLMIHDQLSTYSLNEGNLEIEREGVTARLNSVDTSLSAFETQFVGESTQSGSVVVTFTLNSTHQNQGQPAVTQSVKFAVTSRN